MRTLLALFVAAVAASPLLAAPKDAPSRPASKGCRWEKASDPGVGLAAWVGRCDYGFRKIDFFLKKPSLFQRFSDGGSPEPLVDVFDLRPGETPEAGVKRVFAEKTDGALAAKCVMKPWKETKGRPGVTRYTFLPNAAFQKEIDAKGEPDSVPDPPCGDWGYAPDGIQYFETQRDARRILFVRVGQDEPLFDEQTLKVISPK